MHRVSKFPTVFGGRIVDRCDVLHRVSKFPTVFGGRGVGRCGVLHGLKFPAWHVGGLLITIFVTGVVYCIVFQSFPLSLWVGLLTGVMYCIVFQSFRLSLGVGLLAGVEYCMF